MMPIVLHSWARKAALLAITALPLGLYSAWSVRIARAEYLSNHGGEEGSRLASQLEPNNAEYHLQLGRKLFVVDQDWNGAAAEFQRAAALNPHDARNWLELSFIHQVRGESDLQEVAVKKALAAEPTTPDVAWEAANLYLVSDREVEALKQFHVVIANDKPKAIRALQLCWRATRDVDSILRYALPESPHAYAAFLSVLAEQQEMAGAQKVWQKLISFNEPFDQKAGLQYVNLLIAKGTGEQASTVWNQMTAVLPTLAAYKPIENLVVNSSFEHPLLKSGLDWHVRQDQRYSMELDSSELHSGAYSVAFSANARGIDDFGLVQYVPVQPSTAYHFRGFMKADELLTASGPRFVIHDNTTGAALMSTAEVIGTVQWQELLGDFHTGPETRFVRVHVQRSPGDQVITGKFWVDDLELTAR